MEFARGNFVCSKDDIIAEVLEQQRGKFGYVGLDGLRIALNDKMYVTPDAYITRQPPASINRKVIKVTAVRQGFVIELLGVGYLTVTELQMCREEPPKSHDIPVTAIKVGETTHTGWDIELLYINIETLPLSQDPRYFIEYDRLAQTMQGNFSTSHLSGVKQRSGQNRFPIRRLAPTHYEVHLPRRGWTRLHVN